MGAAPSFSNLRPGYPICPPAVARHMVYRLRLDDNPHWPSDKQRSRTKDKWAALCERFAEHVAELRRDYGNPDDKVNFLEPGEPADAAKGCFSLGASCLVPITKADEPDGYRLRVRIDVHTELVSLTYLFDRIVGGRLAECIAGLKRDAPKARPASDWLFDGMWNVKAGRARRVAAAKAVAKWGRLVISKRRRDRWNDVHITDFKGIIVCPDPEWLMGETKIGDDIDEPTHRRPDRRRTLAPHLATFAERHNELIRAIADPHSLDLEAGEPGDSVSRACIKGGEPVVCGMLDGAALYAAALGEWGGDEKPHPIRHLLVYAGHSYSQVGRLVRRMHVLGELRHAALIDYDADDKLNPSPGRRGLRETSRKLRSLGRELTADTPRITAALELAEGAAAARGNAGAPHRTKVRPFTAKQAMDRLTKIVNELADVSAMVDGGLTHRVEQSRYYAGEFKATVEQLRIIRLGAWQPYDDFVQRYIVHLFARVDRIGNRYEALGRRVDRLLFFQQAKLLDRYTDNVARTVEKIGKVTEALEKSARAQTHLLSAAEWFAAVFLIYYTGTVVKYSVEAHQIPFVTKELYTLWWTRTMVAASMVLVAYIAYSKTKRWRTERKKRAAGSANSARGAEPQTLPQPR